MLQLFVGHRESKITTKRNRACGVGTVFATAVLAGCAATSTAGDEHAEHHPATVAVAQNPAGSTAPAGMAAMQAEMGANMKKMQAQMAAMMATMQGMHKGGGMMMGEGGMPMQGREAGGMGMMPMMQMMMDQMMQHQKAMEGMPK
jgi:hypothetical protein